MVMGSTCAEVSLWPLEGHGGLTTVPLKKRGLAYVSFLASLEREQARVF